MGEGSAFTPRGKKISLFVFILAPAVFFYGAFGSNALLLSPEGEAATLTEPEDSSFSVPYAEIASMEQSEEKNEVIDVLKKSAGILSKP